MVVRRTEPAVLVFVATLFGCAADASSPSSGSSAPRHDSTGASLPEPGPAPAPSSSSSTSTPPAPAAPVSFTMLTYNVAGLPQGISHSDPAVNTKLISPKLNPYELVVVQEDFTYHADLISAVTHPYLTTPMQTSGENDGLNGLSRFAFQPADVERTTWTACNGVWDSGGDCLAKKGFIRFVATLASGLEVDVYDVHFDAGRNDADVTAREAQVSQFVGVVNTKSFGRPVIIAGDTNMKTSDEPTYTRLLQEANLTDACRSISCAEPDRIDRVMFRSTDKVKIEAKSWEWLTWTDDAGQPLSDHEPVAVQITVSPSS